MLRNLSPRERDALVELGNTGPAGTFDQMALSKLLTFGLIEVDSDRRIALTPAGREIYFEILSLEAGKPHGDGKVSGELFPPHVQPRPLE